MDSLKQDVRYAVRTLAKHRGFTAIAVLCLALGIGANATIFSVVNALLLRPLPYAEPNRLVALYETDLKDPEARNALSFADFADIRAGSTSFEALALHYSRFFTVTGGDQPEGVEGEVVTPSLFRILGYKPILGRDFLPEEEQQGKEHVLLLSHGFWERRFASDPKIVGQTLQLNGVAYTVIGVMPRRFSFPEGEQIWVPMALDASSEPRGNHYMDGLGRLKHGVTVEQATRDVNTIAAQLARQYPKTNAGSGATVRPFREELVAGEIRTVVWVMFGAVCFVLAIACANVANLLLARASAREREIAVRTALGASRGRIIRQLLTESVLVALMGGGLGVLFAHLGLKAMIANIPAEIPFWMVFDLDPRVLAFTLVISLVTGLLFGLAPALQASNANLQASLKEGGRGSGAGARRNRLRSSLVIAEVALSLVLLIGASLMVKSFLRLRSVNPGFDAANALTVRIYLGGDKYTEIRTRATIFANVLERLRALPGVSNAAAVSSIPLSGNNSSQSFEIEGQPATPGNAPSAAVRTITATYFGTMKIPLVSGRPFTDREMMDSTPVVLVNQTLAERYWPGKDAIGRRLRMGTDSTAPWLTVVGVAPEVKMRELDTRPEAQIYTTFAFVPYRTMSLIVRTGCPPQAGGCDPTALAAAVRAAVHEVDPTLPLIEMETLRWIVDASFWEKGLYGKMFGVFGIVALVLAAVGVYGVMAYAVSQRTQELGVRMALGAQRGDVFRLVVGRGLWLAGIGLAIGLLGAFGLTRVLSSVLYGVTATDPFIFGGISLLLGGVAFLASYLPARRATRVDPIVALRYE
ncbi:MAG: ABC transporter permease [Gemmatimonadaceae bacterium]